MLILCIFLCVSYSIPLCFYPPAFSNTFPFHTLANYQHRVIKSAFWIHTPLICWARGIAFVIHQWWSVGLGCYCIIRPSWGGSIRFVFNAAVRWRGLKGLCMCCTVCVLSLSAWMCSCLSPSLRSLFLFFNMHVSLIFHLVLHASLRLSFRVVAGSEVDGVRWSQQEATSVVWHLTRMDCMNDALGAHRAFSGQPSARLKVSKGHSSPRTFPPSRL